MSSEVLKDFLSSGRKLITDTKIKYIKNASKEAKVLKEKPVAEGNPHQVFVKRTILEKPKKSEIVEEFVKFIKSAEEQL
jgi:ABC-type molybdate transport system substrate-binding protein